MKIVVVIGAALGAVFAWKSVRNQWWIAALLADYILIGLFVEFFG